MSGDLKANISGLLGPVTSAVITAVADEEIAKMAINDQITVNLLKITAIVIGLS